MGLKMTNDQQIPYAHLEPDVILDAVESVGFVCSGSLLALNSYENRVYQIGIEESAPMIAKFYRPHRWSNASILEEHQFAQELSTHEIPVVAPWLSAEQHSLFEHNDYRFALFPCFGGRALELDSLEHLALMGRFIGRLHAVGACKSFKQRPSLDVQAGMDAYQLLMHRELIPSHLKEAYSDTALSVLAKVGQCFAQVGPLAMLRLHGDAHAGNVLWRDTGPHMVDLDDCLMGPAVQDLWMLLSGDDEQMTIQLNCILAGYREFHDFNRGELKLIEALRSLRMLQYSAWLAKRWHDPAFPLSFPWFNSSYYWQEQCINLKEQEILLSRVLAGYDD